MMKLGGCPAFLLCELKRCDILGQVMHTFGMNKDFLISYKKGDKNFYYVVL